MRSTPLACPLAPANPWPMMVATRRHATGQAGATTSATAAPSPIAGVVIETTPWITGMLTVGPITGSARGWVPAGMLASVTLAVPVKPTLTETGPVSAGRF